MLKFENQTINKHFTSTFVNIIYTKNELSKMAGMTNDNNKYIPAVDNLPQKNRGW